MILISTSMSFQVNHSLQFGSSLKIIAVHCNFMAGLAESCSHVGALLFAIEAVVKIRNSASDPEQSLLADAFRCQ